MMIIIAHRSNGRDQRNGRRVIIQREMFIRMDHIQCTKMSQLKMIGRNWIQKIGRKTIKNMDQSTNHKNMTQKNGKKMIINQAIGRKDIHTHTKVITMDHTQCTKMSRKELSGRKMMENTDQNTQNQAKIKKSIRQKTNRSTKTIHRQKITNMSQKILKKIIKLLANM